MIGVLLLILYYEKDLDAYTFFAPDNGSFRIQ